jgi:ATF/CREB family transcription factor
MPRPSRLDQEPNPFEQSFASGGTSGASGDPLATPKAILPPVTAMTSPAPLLGGSGYNWGPHSLRSGPLSPAMLQGPTNPSGLGFDHIRSGLTPNESGIRSGLTPGGTGGPMFPVPSPSTSQLFFGGGSTPGTMEFQKTALSAARKSHPPPPLIPPSSQDIKMDDAAPNPVNQTASIQQPNPHNNPQQKPRQPSDPFNDSAHNAAYMLAQLGGQPNQYQQQPPQHMQASAMQQNGNMSMESSPNLAKRVAVNNANTANQNRSFSGPSAQSSVRGTSEMSPEGSDSDEEHTQNGRKRNTKGRSNTNTGKRKNEETNTGGKAGGSAKKTKNSRSGMSGSDDGEEYEENEHGETQRKDGKKMTDEEKRKNFLERNRYVNLYLYSI